VYFQGHASPGHITPVPFLEGGLKKRRLDKYREEKKSTAAVCHPIRTRG